MSSGLRNLFYSETAGGAVLFAAAALAVIMANSSLAEPYFSFAHAAHAPVNHGLMAVFFLLAGLEIRRECMDGALSTPARAALPLLAAAGGMAVPALVFLLVNAGHPENFGGWAIPSATDIAFAVGVLALAGRRVPVAVRALLLAIAVIDDIGAIVIIALFYAGFSLSMLSSAGAVAAAFIVPRRFIDKVEHALKPWVAFLVMPFFAFVNAGLDLSALSPASLLEPLPLGIAAGLCLGKPLGVCGTIWLAVRSKRFALPPGMGWRHAFGMSLLCGIGFTMSLFIGMLAFPDGTGADMARLGVLAGSLLSLAAGYGVLRVKSSP